MSDIGPNVSCSQPLCKLCRQPRVLELLSHALPAAIRAQDASSYAVRNVQADSCAGAAGHSWGAASVGEQPRPAVCPPVLQARGELGAWNA